MIFIVSIFKVTLDTHLSLVTLALSYLNPLKNLSKKLKKKRLTFRCIKKHKTEISLQIQHVILPQTSFSMSIFFQTLKLKINLKNNQTLNQNENNKIKSTKKK